MRLMESDEKPRDVSEEVPGSEGIGVEVVDANECACLEF